MAEYINKEVLIQTLKDNTTEMESDIYYESNMGIPEDEIENIVNEVPTEDVVKVVRCKNCNDCEILDEDSYYCSYFNKNVDSDGYCSYGG